MKSSIIKLLRRCLSGFDLVEIILPVINLLVGLGIVRHSSKVIDAGLFLQTVLFFLFLEFGSQFFQFYKKAFLPLPSKKPVPEERSAIILLVILFYGLSVLPLTQIVLDPKSGPSFLMILAVTSFLSLIWRNIGEALIFKVLSLFIFLLNNAFFIPLSQLTLYDIQVNSMFTSISQVLFLSLLGLFLLREIVRIEINRQKSWIVRSTGTIPLLRISVICLIMGWALLILLVLRQPAAVLITIAAISIGLLLIIIYQLNNLGQVGKQGLIHIFRWVILIMISYYLGLGFFLWIS